MLFTKPTHQTQEQRIFTAIKNSHQPSGVTNWQLSRIALNYTMRVSELRKDGHNIIAVRDKLPNGKASNTFRYYLVAE
jgi:hypothetical protein